MVKELGIFSEISDRWLTAADAVYKTKVASREKDFFVTLKYRGGGWGSAAP